MIRFHALAAAWRGRHRTVTGWMFLSLLFFLPYGAGQARAQESSTATAVDGGNVVGYSFTASGHVHAFL